MAERCDGMDVLKSTRSNIKYNWAEWTDGSVWKLTKGVDFRDLTSVQVSCYATARQYGKKAVTRRAEGGRVLYIQFLEAEKP